MIIHRDLIQQSPEWFELKLLKLSGSKAQAIGNCGKGLDTLCSNLIKDYIKHKKGIEVTGFSSKDTERGNEHESLARTLFELEVGIKINQVGFIEINKYLGISPDGIVENDNKIISGIEIKCPNYDNFYDLLIGEKKIDSLHIWQCQMNMLLTGAELWYLVYFNVEFNQSIIINKIYPDKEMYDKLNKGIHVGNKKIETLLSNPVIQKELNV